MTKVALTKAPTSLLECAVYILLDRGCAVSAMRDYLKLHISRTLPWQAVDHLKIASTRM